jgi:probable rRNA maturation factor
MQRCSFHDFDIVSGLKHKRKMALLVKEILKKKKENYNINYIFCSDEYLLRINKEYLKHNTLTDIITFDLSEKGSDLLLADIYISLERVQENAAQYNVKFTQELLRVIIHGMLHLIGYKDKTAAQKTSMRRMETRWINNYTKNILPL